MEQAARRSARWLLAIHALLLVGVILVVFLAAREVYFSSRDQAIQQASGRQRLLAEQTGRGIESYYKSIIDSLNLLRWADQLPGRAEGPGRVSAAIETLGPSIWDQVKDRASLLFIFTRETGQIDAVFPSDAMDKARSIVEQNGNSLKEVREATLSNLMKVGGEDANLVCVPVVPIPQSRRLFVAVVPIANIDAQFLRGMRGQQQLSVLLMDDVMRVMSASDKRIVGLSVIDDGWGNDRINHLATRYRDLGTAGSEVFEQGFAIGEHKFDSGMLSIQPIDVPGKRWWLSVGSDLAEVNSIVSNTFRPMLMCAIFLLVATTAILLSSAGLVIRTQMRLERARHAVLTHELAQARDIQLAWLPDNEDDPPRVDLSAVNKPASHVSGDFYNWFELRDGRVCALIGDVTGHGMAGAFLMATTQLLVRMTMLRLLDPGKCLEEVNRQLCRHAFAGQLVTMQILLLDVASGRVEYASAGHPPMLVQRGEKFVPVDLGAGLVMGIDRTAAYETYSFDLDDGCIIALYTDGVSEAGAPDGSRLNIDYVAEKIVGPFSDAESVVTRIIEIVDQFRGTRALDDDLTVVAIKPQSMGEPLGANSPHRYAVAHEINPSDRPADPDRH